MKRTITTEVLSGVIADVRLDGVAVVTDDWQVVVCGWDGSGPGAVRRPAVGDRVLLRFGAADHDVQLVSLTPVHQADPGASQ